MANELRELVETATFLSDQKITISLGVAEHEEGETSHSWFKRADKALYKTKKEGRNQCVVVNDSLALKQPA